MLGIHVDAFFDDVIYDPRRGLMYVLGGAGLELVYAALRSQPALEGLRTLLFLAGLALIVKGTLFCRRPEALERLWPGEDSLTRHSRDGLARVAVRTGDELEPVRRRQGAARLNERELKPEQNGWGRKLSYITQEIALLAMMAYVAGKRIKLPESATKLLFVGLLVFVAVNAIRQARIERSEGTHWFRF